MYFLLSGEGPTDIGSGKAAGISESDDFAAGPMAVLIDRIVESKWNYRLLETDGSVGFLSEAGLVAAGEHLKTAKKSIRLPGAKVKKETRYFFNQARALAGVAAQLAEDKNDEVVAILFRDSDGTASAGRGLWEDKHQSMLDGFAEEGFANGVPMIPKPKSEAWLLCALKANPYQNCEQLENRSGNDNSPKSLKKDLAKCLGGEVTAERLAAIVAAAAFDVDRIEMPSLQTFRERLESML